LVLLRVKLTKRIENARYKQRERERERGKRKARKREREKKRDKGTLSRYIF
jgi:hypothetical protein